MKRLFIKRESPKDAFLRLSGLMIVVSLFWSLTSCSVPTASLTPSPTKIPATMTPIIQVEITKLLAVAHGTLVLKGNCLKLESSDAGDGEYSILWTPDYAVVMDGNTIKATSGVVTGFHEEIILQIGEDVTLMGGVGDELGPEYKNQIPANCAPPFWIISDVVSHNP